MENKRTILGIKGHFWEIKECIDFRTKTLATSLATSFLDVSSQDNFFLKILGAVFSHGLDILTPKLPKISPDIAISAYNTTLYMISNAKTPSKEIGALIRFMQFLSSWVALYLYKYIIRPCMEYCCHI